MNQFPVLCPQEDNLHAFKSLISNFYASQQPVIKFIYSDSGISLLFVFKYLNGGHKRICSQGSFQWCLMTEQALGTNSVNNRKHFFSLKGLCTDGRRLPRGVVVSPSLEVFRCFLVIWTLSWIIPWVTRFRGSSQP